MVDSESLIQWSSAEIPIEYTPSIKSAQNFFESTFGLSVGVDGLLKGDVSPTQLKSLSDWHEITSDEGIDMPTENIFYKKVLLAVSLWPQKDKEGINYLLVKRNRS